MKLNNKVKTKAKATKTLAVKVCTNGLPASNLILSDNGILYVLNKVFNRSSFV